MEKTPVIVFAYNRPAHLQQTLEALARCRRFDECRVFIYCDGVKKPEHVDKVTQTRTVAMQWGRMYGAEVVLRDKNLGLKKSIILGVTQACEDFGRVIVLEDDIVVSPGFLDFMLQALERYKDEARVYGVAAYLFTSERIADEDAFFLPLTSSWGWATWKRAWDGCDFDIKGAPLSLKDEVFVKRFDLDGAYPWSKILEKESDHSIDSWAIGWYYHVFMHDGLVVYPAYTLVYNSGFDSSGVHCGNVNANPIQMTDLKDFWSQALFNFPAVSPVNPVYLERHRQSILEAYAKPPFSLSAWVKSKMKRLLISLCLFSFVKKMLGGPFFR